MVKSKSSARRSKQKSVNLSAAIRDYLNAKPDAKPAEIVEFLSTEHGANVSPQYVSTIKSNTRRKQRSMLSDDPALQRLQLAKEFCQQMGGVDKAERAIRDWAALTNNS